MIKRSEREKKKDDADKISHALISLLAVLPGPLSVGHLVLQPAGGAIRTIALAFKIRTTKQPRCTREN